MPTEAAISRCGSFVAASLITTWAICPALRYFSPWFLGMILQWGGKMLETRTMFSGAMSAFRSAISKELSFSLCFPMPLVRKIFEGTYIGVWSPGGAPLQTHDVVAGVHVKDLAGHAAGHV